MGLAPPSASETSKQSESVGQAPPYSVQGKGKVYLVGAGPGRADLITLRGAELLKTADCVIMDKLANPALLELARKDAEIIHVPKRIGPGSFTQDQINRDPGRTRPWKARRSCGSRAATRASSVAAPRRPRC